MIKKFLKFVVLDPEYVIFKKQTDEEIKIVDEMHKYVDYVINLIKDENALNKTELTCTTSSGEEVKIYSENSDQLVCEVKNSKTSYIITILFK